MVWLGLNEFHKSLEKTIQISRNVSFGRVLPQNKQLFKINNIYTNGHTDCSSDLVFNLQSLGNWENCITNYMYFELRNSFFQTSREVATFYTFAISQAICYNMCTLRLIFCWLFPQNHPSHKPVSGQCSNFIHPENTRKPLIFCVFRGYQIGTLARNELEEQWYV